MAIQSSNHAIRDDLALALLYGHSDTSTENEDQLLENWERTKVAEATIVGAGYSFEVSDLRELTQCEITGELAECAEVVFNLITQAN